ncbi:uncharacterized protein LOC127835889 isoform X3 [Dreissena polymorpha]|uniref:uncharacterized protein LOC127835889 isoform X3 n=1 Tax=Dreissena polymorpha TaxID=45954 RepID=UPI002264AF51|nr:uncharacterized protein LOC127835889 isoform X3 [Dreissena polymorpha]
MFGLVAKQHNISTITLIFTRLLQCTLIDDSDSSFWHTSLETMLQASRHQGDSMFKNSGRQCMANSLSAILTSYIQPPPFWDKQVMNNILFDGDNMYTEIISKTKNNYINVDEIPSAIGSYSIAKDTPISGTIHRKTTEKPFYCLSDVFTPCLSDKFFIFTMGFEPPAYTSAIVFHKQQFYFFDPHSRSETGMCTPDGFSTMTVHKSVDSLCRFIQHLAASIFHGSCQDTPFEATQLVVAENTEDTQKLNFTHEDSTDAESEFSGFSSQSEGDLVCRLFLAQESLNDSDSNFSFSDSSIVTMDSVTNEDVLKDLNDTNDLTMSEIKSLGSDLHEIEGVGYDLHEIDGVGSDLHEIEGVGSDLHEIEGVGSDLHEIEGVGSDLHEREGVGSDLHEIEGVGSDLHEIEGVGSDLHEIEGVGSGLHEIDGVGSDLHEREGVGSDLHEIEGVESDLYEREGVGSDLHEIEGVGSDLHEIEGVGSDLHEIEAVGSGLHEREGLGSDLHEIEGVGSDLHEIEGVGSDLHEIEGVGSDLNEIEDVGSDLHEIEGVGSDLHEIEGLGSDLHEIEGVGSDLHEIKGLGSDLHEIEGVGSDLHEIEGVGSDLHEIEGAGSYLHEDLEVVVSDLMIGQNDSFSKADSDLDDEDIPLIHLSKKYHKKQVDITAQQADKQHVSSSSDLNNTMTSGRGRKRVRNIEEWKRNVMKRRRNEGKSYESRKGKLQSQRCVKKGCGMGCRYKCHNNFTENERHKLFDGYWQMGDVNKQRNFIIKFAIQKPVNTRRSNINSVKRTSMVLWTLPKKMPDGTTVPVRICKTFFLSTLDVSSRIVSTAHAKQTDIGMCADDCRGKHHVRPNKTSELQEQMVKQHIESFPRMESHYRRKDSKKEYLASDLNVVKMYHLYANFCEENDHSPVSIFIYRQIFDEQYNLSFYKPLKDQCDLCVSFKNANEHDKSEMASNYKRHLQNKDLVKAEKTKDKEKAKLVNTMCVASFDLEQILQTPHSFESCLFYKRRLNSYNFTLYDMGNSNGYCYVWNETIAKRGGCEIASCVKLFIEQKSSEGVKDFVFYSDNCLGQNKNKFYLSMLWFCLHKYNLKSITHNYLEKGHTFSENDSIHAAIENASRNISIYTTPQWAATIRTSRRKNPYSVREMSLFDFQDFKLLSSLLKNFDKNTDGDKVYWTQIRSIHISENLNNVFEYRSDFNGPVGQVDLFQRLRTKDQPNPKLLSLSVLRQAELPLSREKMMDLVGLCRKNIIPPVHHAFYLLLPHE